MTRFDEDTFTLTEIKNLLFVAETCLNTALELSQGIDPEDHEMRHFDLRSVINELQCITSDDREDSLIKIADNKASYYQKNIDNDFYKKTKKDYENWINSNLLR